MRRGGAWVPCPSLRSLSVSLFRFLLSVPPISVPPSLSPSVYFCPPRYPPLSPRFLRSPLASRQPGPKKAKPGSGRCGGGESSLGHTGGPGGAKKRKLANSVGRGGSSSPVPKKDSGKLRRACRAESRGSTRAGGSDRQAGAVRRCARGKGEQSEQSER